MIFFIFILFIVVSVSSVLIYLRYRRLLREAKNYERGLKMVSLLIHLPPSSDDTQVGSRDARDVAEETISKAQVLYNIIASTATKGFKSKFYGQRHIAFEIVATKGSVHYYAAVPVAMVSVVTQAVVSAYPAASLQEVEEHNIFSPVGKISGTIGGELVLKEEFVHPIATFSETKRDAMQSILNSFSTLAAEDGAAIQLLLRPARDGWTKRSLAVASEKKDGKSSSGGGAAFGNFLRQIFEALWKPPESADEKKNDHKPLSNLEQSNIDSIEEKTRHPGYEALIRIVASSNTSSRSQSILNNIVAAFALFDAPGKNGFKFAPAKDIERFITAYIFRFFPPQLNSIILNSVELATVFHLPDQRSTPTSQLSRQASKQVDGPNSIPEEGLLLGYNVFRGVKKEIRLSSEDRRRHLYTVGQTGTGKSVFLENLALQDMLDGRGFAFIDPHGDAVEKLVSMVPKERTEDVIYFSPADMEYPMGLNLFEFGSPDQKDFLIQEAINMLYKLYDPQHTGIIGPRYEHWFRNAALTLMSDPGGSTFIDIPKVFTDNQYAKQKLQHVTDPTVLDFWNKEMAKTTDYHKSEILGWFVSKFGAFVSNEMMRNIIGQTKSSFDLRQVMDEGKILLVNLSKGRTGELNSKLLGMIFVMKFQAAAMSRASIPEDQRTDFSLYVDEFQNFSTDSFATILSEARKYHLNLIVANQFITQLSDEVRDAVFGNVGSVISLRTGANDADFLVKQFSPVFDSEDLVKLPNYNAVTRLMANGVPSQPFSMATIPPLGHPNPELGIAIKKLSAAKFGRPKALVEKEIFTRLETKAVPRPAAKSPFGAPASPAGFGPQTGAGGSAGSKSGTKSFLDEWLEKRKAQKSSAPTQQQGVPAQTIPTSPVSSAPSPAPPSSGATVVPNPSQPITPQPQAYQPQQSPVAPTQPVYVPPSVQQQPVQPYVPPAPAQPPVVGPNYQPASSQPTAPAVEVPSQPDPMEPLPGMTVGENLKPPPTQSVSPPMEANLDESEDETIGSGAPTEFASQMEELKRLHKERQSSLAGSRRDKDDISEIANVVKDQIDSSPVAEREVEEKPKPKPVMPVFSDDNEEIYIDKDGRIHYGTDDGLDVSQEKPAKKEESKKHNESLASHGKSDPKSKEKADVKENNSDSKPDEKKTDRKDSDDDKSKKDVTSKNEKHSKDDKDSNKKNDKSDKDHKDDKDASSPKSEVSDSKVKSSSDDTDDKDSDKDKNNDKKSDDKK